MLLLGRLFECHWKALPSGMFRLHLLRQTIRQQSVLLGRRTSILWNWLEWIIHNEMFRLRFPGRSWWSLGRSTVAQLSQSMLQLHGNGILFFFCDWSQMSGIGFCCRCVKRIWKDRASSPRVDGHSVKIMLVNYAGFKQSLNYAVCWMEILFVFSGWNTEYK